jgi:hypothetical protein
MFSCVNGESFKMITNLELYERDFQLWLTATIRQLEQGNFQALDVSHLVEELKELGKSDKNALEGNLMILLAHLLKLKIQSSAPESMKSSWYRSIVEHSWSRSIVEHRERVIALL